MSENTFKLLKSQVGKAIYDLKWERFRLIQDEAIKAVVQTKKDIIISAPTASGKTEAAFLPAISEAIPEINTSLKIVYISPLKALINDQFFRIDNLCKYLKCKVTKWHGDASQTHKDKLLTTPSGILLITPESLESFLINRSSLIDELFKNVDFYVIDEVHSFVGGPRGDQLRSILNRLDSTIKRRPRRILLSATIGSLENYKIWLNNDDPFFIEDKNEGKGIKGSIRYFENNDDKESYYKELEKLTSTGKKLVFGTSKGHLEETCSTLKSFTKDDNSHIEIHHGSLSKEQREFVENRLRKEPLLSVFCTNTLELGIDIGNIDEISLISPPWSVASFIQKIGRSGRKEDSKIEFNFVLTNPPVTSKSHICDGLRVELIQSIALVELMLEGWCEPGSSQTNSYSTFVHQMMAHMAQKRSTNSDKIWNEISSKSFSEKVSKTDFNEIIEHLTNTDYINRDGRGNYILGNKGDRLTEHYDFYSVFFTPDEWTIHAETKKLGTIPLKNIFREGDTILFSGKKWKVKNVDFSDKVLQVIPAKVGNPPKFLGTGGTNHKKVHQMMKSIYEGEEIYRYLTDSSSLFLESTRKTYKILSESDKFLPFFMGSGVCNVAAFILRTAGHDFEDLDFALYLNDLSKSDALDILKKYNDRTSINNLVSDVPIEELFFEKFDHLLPKSILRKSFINSLFDVDNYLNFLKISENQK